MKSRLLTSLSKDAAISDSGAPIWGTMAAFWLVLDLAKCYFCEYFVTVKACFEQFNRCAVPMFSVLLLCEKAVIVSNPCKSFVWQAEFSGNRQQHLNFHYYLVKLIVSMFNQRYLTSPSWQGCHVQRCAHYYLVTLGPFFELDLIPYCYQHFLKKLFWVDYSLSGSWHHSCSCLITEQSFILNHFMVVSGCHCSSRG